MAKNSFLWSLVVAAVCVTMGADDAEARCCRRIGRGRCNSGCNYQSTGYQTASYNSGYQNSACCGAQGYSNATNPTMNSTPPASNQTPAPPPVESAPAPRT